MKIYDITPVPKPRMTRRDIWLNPPRPGVARYWKFKDQVIAAKLELPEDNAHVVFVMPMPPSWSKKKRKEMAGQKHKQTPDWDNLGKALSDAVYGNDSVISDIRITKVWGSVGQIIIK